MSKTTVTHKDVEILDLPTPANFTVGSKLISEYVAAMDSALGGSSAKYVKESFKIQLDAPSTPVILPGASHTYSINLGVAFEHLAITNFEWVVPASSNEVPDVVIGSAAFPEDKFGGCLIVNTTPGGWVRGYKHQDPEFANASATEIHAPFYATSADVSVPLGYGSSAYQVPLDHTALQTTPPKKLQIQDAYLDGTNLKITIKNVDTVAIDLSAYVGVTALIDHPYKAQIAAISENGTLFYTYGDPNSSPVQIRYTLDQGKTFDSIQMPTGTTIPRIASIAATNNSMNTFFAMLNYQYVRTTQSPDYLWQNKVVIEDLAQPEGKLQFSIGASEGWTHNTRHSGDKLMDWKKTDTFSIGLFSAFVNYQDVLVFKSVDDFANVGDNSPAYDNKLPILKASVDVPDFERASIVQGSPNASHPSFDMAKAQVKAIDENTHYLNLTYYSKPESLKNGRGMSPAYLGAQNITGDDGFVYGVRNDEAVFSYENFGGVSALGAILIENSTLGNNGPRTTVGGSTIGFMKPLYVGPGTWGEGPTVTTNGNQLVVKKSDWDALSEPVLLGDQFTINGIPTSNPQLFGIEDAQITIASVLTDVKVLTFRYSDPGTGPHLNMNPPFPSTDGGGDVIPFIDIIAMKTGRLARISGKYFNIWRSIPQGSSPATFVTETDPNVKVTFIADLNTIKQKLLKTTDGGQTWTSIMEHPEYRYGLASVFHASNDGQTLLLASMRYWEGTGYEKWPYAPAFGNEARFNMSTDGGATWKNATGSWDKIGDDLIRLEVRGNDTFGLKATTGQVAAKIDDTILMVLYKTQNSRPALYRSEDNGTTWAPAVILNPLDTGNGFTSYASDSKDAFMAFVGANYLSSNYQYVFYGALVEKFTQWPTYGVTA